MQVVSDAVLQAKPVPRHCRPMTCNQIGDIYALLYLAALQCSAALQHSYTSGTYSQSDVVVSVQLMSLYSVLISQQIWPKQNKVSR